MRCKYVQSPRVVIEELSHTEKLLQSLYLMEPLAVIRILRLFQLTKDLVADHAEQEVTEVVVVMQVKSLGGHATMGSVNIDGSLTHFHILLIMLKALTWATPREMLKEELLESI